MNITELWAAWTQLDEEIRALEEAAIAKGLVKRDAEDGELHGDWGAEEACALDKRLGVLEDRRGAMERSIYQMVPSSVGECAIWLRALTGWVDFEDYEHNQGDVAVMVRRVADVLDELKTAQ